MTQQQRNTLMVVAAVAVSFGAGTAWQFSKARQARMERDTVRQEVASLQQQQALERLEATLAMATVAAQFGDFERGRQLASDFFALLQEKAATVPGTARPALSEILARRDAVITMLSRAEPQSGLELAALLTWLQNALGKQPTVPAYQQVAPPGGAQG
jgi:hypothetical protein